MRTAATGMMAQQMNVDNIANNLANVNTTGFKKARVEFQDLFYQKQKSAGSPTASGTRTPLPLEIGYGSTPVSTQRLFSQGELVSTGNAADIAIKGDGFLRVILADGREAYTRDGSFKISAEGAIITSDGNLLDPEITIPADASQVTIDGSGTVSVSFGAGGEAQVIGQIELARFINPAGLHALGQNLYLPTDATGDPVPGTPGQDGYGSIAQGYLEVSNVDIVGEMVELITAQRAYEISSKTIKAAEDMMSMANDIVR